MKNKKILRANLSGFLLSGLLLTGCGTQDAQILTVAEETMQATAENTQMNAQAQTEGTAENAQDIANSVAEAEPLAQRNALEWEQRLDYTTERQAQLAEITVDLAQDTEEVQDKAKGLLDAMSEGDAEAAVDSILAEDWYSVMLSDLLIGQRNYTQATGGGDCRMTILADELGQHGTAVEYPLTDGGMFYLQVTDTEIRYYVCAADHTGNFTSAVLNLVDGSYVSYEGTLSAAHRPEGMLTIQVGAADTGSGAAAAFHNRSAQITTYEGEFSADGKPAMSTPANLVKEGKVAYASAKEGKTTYYLTVSAEGTEEMFTPEQLGISTLWE